MRTIVTLTMNPALDASTAVPFVLPDQKLRCEVPHYDPGGGGINVARVIHRLGGDALAAFPIGGAAGELLQSLLGAEGVPQMAVPVRSWTRENLNVLEQVSGRQFRFLMPGAALGEDEWPCFLSWIEGLQPRPEYVVASGSLPPGVPTDFYARLARLVRRVGARLVLDTSGEPLAEAVREGVHLLKPSLRELRALAGTPGDDDASLTAIATAAVREQRWCEVLVVSLGAARALWVDAQASEHLTAPSVPVQSTVGAGDSMVAGIVFQLAGGRSVGEAVRFGVAAGAAAVLRPGTALCERADIERLRDQVLTSCP